MFSSSSVEMRGASFPMGISEVNQFPACQAVTWRAKNRAGRTELFNEQCGQGASTGHKYHGIHHSRSDSLRRLYLVTAHVWISFLCYMHTQTNTVCQVAIIKYYKVYSLINRNVCHIVLESRSDQSDGKFDFFLLTVYTYS